jgi:hypothetical protein
VNLRGLKKRGRWLITVSLTAAIVGAGLSAPATAEVRPQMEASISYDPVVVRAPAADQPEQVVTYEGSVYFSGFDSTPEAYKTTAELELPSGVEIESVSPAECKAQKSTVTCSFGTVPRYEVRTVTVRTKVTQAKVGDRLGATLVAWAKNVDRNPASNSNQNTGPLVVENKADLSVGFYTWRDSVAPGAEMTYGIEARNDGPLITAPAALIIKTGSQLTDPRVRVEDPNTCTRTAEGFRCPFVRWIRLELTGTADPESVGTVLSTSITAEFTGEDPPTDPDPDNNTMTKTTHIEQRADIGVDLSVTPDTVPAEDLADEPALTYRAVVTNNGPGVARDTKLNVHMSNYGVEFVSAPAGCVNDHSVECVVGELAVGASREYIIQAKATPMIRGERADVWAEVTAANNDYNLPNNNQKTATLYVPGNLADLGIEVSAQPNPVVAGQPVTVVAKAANHGPLSKADAEVQVHLSTYLADDVKVEVDGGTCRIASTTNNFIQCTLPELSTQAREIKVTGSTNLAAGDQLTGYATIRAVNDRPVDPVHTNDYASLSVPVGS